jgi:hypothetical protein
MGLPSYIINFDEIKQPIIDAISEASFDVTVGDISLDSASISIDTSAIETSLDDIISKLTTVKDNSTLVKDTTKDILTALTTHDTNMTSKMDMLGTKIEAIIESMAEMYILLEKIKEQLASEGQQRAVGDSIVIPAIAGTYSRTFSFNKDVLITGISMSQSAWNFNDRWSLDVGAFNMFDKIYTKLRGEHKQLSKFLPVPANTDIVFYYDNTSSANSKYVWFDLEFIEVDAISVTPTAPTPPPTTDGSGGSGGDGSSPP